MDSIADALSDAYQQGRRDALEDAAEKERAEQGTKVDFTKRVAGALKSALDAHGPITLANRSAAAKRIAGALFPLRTRLTQEEGEQP